MTRTWKKPFKITRAQGHLYPEQERVTSHVRPKMPNALTDKMAHKQTERGKRTRIENVMTFDRSKLEPINLDHPMPQAIGGTGNRGLEKLGISRNHIVADSFVAILVEHGFHVPQIRNEIMNASKPGKFEKFVQTLGGDEAVQALREAVLLRDVLGKPEEALARLHEAKEKVSLGRGNIRFGLAKENVDILHGLDLEFDERGNITEKSERAMEALHGLWGYPELQKHALNAGQQTIKEKSLGVDNNGSTLKGGEYRSSSEGKTVFPMSEIDHLTSKSRSLKPLPRFASET
jgi:hypothetical protein